MRTKAEQIKLAFVDGGMVDSGKDVEATTGNDIPPGSLPEEVKDQVDAKLSPGEYVIPADVVQHLGLQKLEKLVDKSKEELAELDARGRIGGKEVDESGKEKDDFPLSDEELLGSDGELKMAQGGFVPGANTGIENKVYVGPNGERRTVMYVNGMPIQAVPQGFVLENKAKAQAKQTKKLDPMTKNTSPNVEDKAETKDVSDWTNDEIGEFIGSQKAFGAAQKASLIGGPLGLAMAGVMGIANNATREKALKEVEQRLANQDLDDRQRAQLSEYKSALEEMESKNKEEDDGEFKGLFNGGLLSSLVGTDGLLGGWLNEQKSKSKETTASTQNTPNQGTPTDAPASPSVGLGQAQDQGLSGTGGK